MSSKHCSGVNTAQSETVESSGGQKRV
jgi:hypothetical protein